MASAEPQGWYEDPFRLHQARYFSAGRPTKLVRDGNVESYDEPPGEGAPGPDAAASWGHAVGVTLKRAEANEVNAPDPVDDDVPAVPARVRRRPLPGVLTGIAVAAIAGAATAAIIAGKPRPATAPVTEAMAYTATMNASSADVYQAYGITDSSGKLDVTASESGPVSWSADQADLAEKVTSGGRQWLTMRQIIDGTNTYAKISTKGLSASILAGFPGLAGWTDTTWTGASSTGTSGFLPTLFLFGSVFNPAGMSSPSSLLGLLNAQASSVQDLGGDVLDGVSTTHYRALIPLSRLGTGTADEELQLEQLLGTSSLGVDYWIDSSNLLRQLRVAITALRPSDTASSPGDATVPLGTYPITFSISLQLSHYGTPVHVAPPPAAQITSHKTCVLSNDGFSCTS